MAHILADRVRETSVTTGTGNITLAGAVTRFRTVAAAVANGDTWPYVIEHETLNEWEEGVATQLTSTTFSRSPILSSNANALVNFSAGTKQVFLTAPALTSFLRLDGGGTMTGALVASVGLVGTPAITFAGDLDTGLYRAIGGDNVSVTVGGTLRLGVTTTEITSALPVSIPSANTPATPALYFGTDTNTGVYQPAADNIGFSTNSTLRLTIGTTAITPTLVLTGSDGANTAPAYSFASDPNTGMYSGGADIISFATNSTQRITINDVGAMKFFATGTTADPLIRFGNNSYGFNWDGTFINFVANGAVRGYFGTSVFNLSVPLAISHNNSAGNTIAQQGSGVALTITNTGTGNSFVVEDSASTDSTPFVIDNAGKVGIGMTMPTALLHVTGGNIQVDSSSPSMTLNASASGQNNAIYGQTAGLNRWVMVVGNSTAESGSNAGSDFRLTAYDDTGVSIGDAIRITRATRAVNIPASGTVSAPTLGFGNGAQAGINWTSLYQMDFIANSISRMTLTTALFSTTVPVKITNTGSNDSFLVEDSSSTDATPFVIDASGNVGIGIAVPTNKLHVVGDVTVENSTSATLSINSVTTGSQYVTFRRGSLNRWQVESSADAESGSNAGTHFRIRRHDDAGTAIDYVLHMARDTGVVTVGQNGSSGVTERLVVGSVTNNAAESLLRLNNFSTLSNATVDIVFATGTHPGTWRSLIRGHRQGSNGDLSFVTSLAGVEVVNLKLTSNGNATFIGNVIGITPTAASHLTRKDYVDSHDMPVGGSAGQVLTKIDGTDYNVQWSTPPGAGGGLSEQQVQARAFMRC